MLLHALDWCSKFYWMLGHGCANVLQVSAVSLDYLISCSSKCLGALGVWFIEFSDVLIVSVSVRVVFG